MGSPFDLLASADFLVPDRDAAVAMVQRALGFGEPKPRWSSGGDGKGFRVTFCRPHPVLRQSPTLVELISPASLDPSLPAGDVVANVSGLASAQGARPLKTHGTPVASSSVEELIDRARTLGLRHWVQPGRDNYPFLRLWIGIAEDDLSDYRGGDGGLMIEVVDTQTTGVPATTPPPPLDTSAAGTMVRTAARLFLVDDVQRSLDELGSVFGWEPSVGPERSPDGSRRAALGFRVDESARIELLAPAPGTEAGAFLRQWGPGVWSVRIAVSDLDAKAEDLRSRGTPFDVVETGFADPPVVLCVDPAATPACRFEFAALAPSSLRA